MGVKDAANDEPHGDADVNGPEGAHAAHAGGILVVLLHLRFKRSKRIIVIVALLILQLLRHRLGVLMEASQLQVGQVSNIVTCSVWRGVSWWYLLADPDNDSGRSQAIDVRHTLGGVVWSLATSGNLLAVLPGELTVVLADGEEEVGEVMVANLASAKHRRRGGVVFNKLWT